MRIKIQFNYSSNVYILFNIYRVNLQSFESTKTMDLINIFKKFDFFTKYFKISHFNRDLNSMKNKIIVIFLTIYLCFVLIKNTIILILIDENHTQQANGTS